MKLVAQCKKLTTAVDKQQEVISAAHAKMQDLPRELAAAYVDLSHLPERHSRYPRECPENVVATSLLQECVADLEESEVSTQTGDGRTPTLAWTRRKTGSGGVTFW
eukprot:1867826-Amphidinium_carterae.1